MATATIAKGQTNMHIVRPKAKLPQERVEEACIWVRDNPNDFISFANALIELGKEEPRFGRDGAYYIAKQKGMPITLTNLFRRDHNLWAALSRYAIMLRPELIYHIKPKPADIDNIDLSWVWRSIVDPETVFEVGSWKQAAYWCEVYK